MKASERWFTHQISKIVGDNGEFETRTLLKAELRYYMMRYGWISEKESLANYVRYNISRTSYYHPFSAENIGEAFGYNEFKDIIPLSEYMNSPIDKIDDLLSGVAKGERRLKEEIERAKAAKGKGKDPGQVISKELNKRGIL